MVTTDERAELLHCDRATAYRVTSSSATARHRASSIHDFKNVFWATFWGTYGNVRTPTVVPFAIIQLVFAVSYSWWKSAIFEGGVGHFGRKYQQQCVIQFRHNARVWQTDRQNYDSQDRPSIDARAVKILKQLSWSKLKIKRHDNLTISRVHHNKYSFKLTSISVASFRFWADRSTHTHIQTHRLTGPNTIHCFAGGGAGA